MLTELARAVGADDGANVWVPGATGTTPGAPEAAAVLGMAIGIGVIGAPGGRDIRDASMKALG